MSRSPAIPSSSSRNSKGWTPPAGSGAHIPAGIPPPPYIGQDITDLRVTAEFDKASTSSLYPEGIEPFEGPNGDNLGFFVFGHQRKGSGISPFAYASIGLHIKGFDSPGGTPGTFFPVRNFWGEQAQIFFNTPRHTSIRFGRWDDVVEASVGPVGEPDEFRVRIRLTNQTDTHADTLYFYRPKTAFGYNCVLPSSQLAERTKAIPLEVEILGADEKLVKLTPKRLIEAHYDTEKSTTWGMLLPLDGSNEAEKEQGQSLFFHFLARVSQAVVVVGGDMMVSFINQAGEDLLGDVYRNTNGRLAGASRKNDTVLTAVVQAAADGTTDGTAGGMLTRSTSQSHLIVRAMPLPLRTAPGTPPESAALVVLVFTDGNRPETTASAGSLELLGLTPAEARTAALIGVGVAPRDAAAELSISEHTVRTVLKRIYSKLELTRQSELAVLVSRIEAISG